jgi:hypothetical protein
MRKPRTPKTRNVKLSTCTCRRRPCANRRCCLYSRRFLDSFGRRISNRSRVRGCLIAGRRRGRAPPLSPCAGIRTSEPVAGRSRGRCVSYPISREVRLRCKEHSSRRPFGGRASRGARRSRWQLLERAEFKLAISGRRACFQRHLRSPATAGNRRAAEDGRAAVLRRQSAEAGRSLAGHACAGGCAAVFDSRSGK